MCSGLSQVPPDNTVGDAEIALNGQSGGTLQNNRIEASWQIRDARLDSLFIRDKTPHAGFTDATLTLNAPFSVELNAIGVLRASDLRIDGTARIDHLAPIPSASRASDSLPGITVHYSLADPQDRFHADWALTLRQGSHSIRPT